MFVNKSSVLRTAMEEQLMGSFEDKKMPYSKKGEFNFCNLVSFSESDQESIKNFAANMTTTNGGNTSQVQNMSTQQIIEEFHMERCVFDRDTLFTIYVVNNEALSARMQQLNLAGKLMPEDMPIFTNDAVGIYHYAAERSIFTLANSECKKKHAVV